MGKFTNMEELIENEMYIVGMADPSRYPQPIRIARFNGFGEDKGWGGMDWSGDSGYSTDSWNHDQVDWYVPISRLTFNIDQRLNGATKLVTSIGYRVCT